MDFTEITEKLLMSLNDLLSALNQQINDGDNDTFLHRAFQIVQIFITTLERMDPNLKKHINNGIDFIVSSIASLVTKVVSSGAIYKAAFCISLEIGDFFDLRSRGSIPEIMRNKYDEFQRLLETALEKKRNIEALCNNLLDQVVAACKSYCCSLLTVRSLEAERLRISAKISDCEQSVLNVRQSLVELVGMVESEVVKHGLKFGAAALATIGFGYAALQAGITRRGVLCGAAGVGCGVLCYCVAMKLGDFKHVWDKVDAKRSQYGEIYRGLESLKDIVRRELKQGIHLISKPDFSVQFILVILVAFCAVMYTFCTRVRTES